MIAIAIAPKRFVSALVHERFSYPTVVRAVNAFSCNNSSPSFKNFHPSRCNMSTAAKKVQMSDVLDVSHPNVSVSLKADCADFDSFTGKHPKLCPGLTSNGHITSLPQLDLTKATPSAIQDYFDNTWTLTEVLFNTMGLEESTLTRSPAHGLRHPMIFYYGHTACFYVNKLRVAGYITEGLNPYFEEIFEVGVDEMSWDDLSRNASAWPSVQSVKEYRKQVYDVVSNFIGTLEAADCQNIDQSSKLWGLLMAFEHERIHLETSSVLIQELPLDLVKFPSYLPPYYAQSNAHPASSPMEGQHFPQNKMISVPAQMVTIGKDRAYPSYGWDNEYGSKSARIDACSVSQCQISNGEYYEFVKSGGYGNMAYWSDLGWKWRAYRNSKQPMFWVPHGPGGLHEYSLRVLADVVPMSWDWPVVVNYHEAMAYCNWKTSQAQGTDASGGRVVYRVLTEYEHHAIRGSTNAGSHPDHPDIPQDNICNSYGEKESYMDSQAINSNISYSSTCPVDAFPENNMGFKGVFGNVWDWCCDYLNPLPGFQVHPYYEDFSTPCFDGLHQVIVGGSFISTGNEASRYSRFHFRPHFYQHAGFRMVEQHVSGLGDTEVFDRMGPSGMMTSDTDSPGPFVGSYPFRGHQLKTVGASDKARPTAPSKLSLFDKISHDFGREHLSTLFPKANFGAESAAWMAPFANVEEGSNVCVVGCGVGGIPLQCAMHPSVASVVGVDMDGSAINVANVVLKCWEGAGSGSNSVHLDGVDMLLPHVGDVTSLNCSLPLKLQKDAWSKVSFRHADPMCMPAEYHQYDVVILSDVLESLSSPNALLGRLTGHSRGLVKPGGYLVVTSSYAWDEDVTPKSLWLEGVNSGFSDGEKSTRVPISNTLKDMGFVCVSATPEPMTWLTSTTDLRMRNMETSVWHRPMVKK